MNATVVNDYRQDRADAMEKIMLYAYNYDSKFIQKAFADNPRIRDHFQSKFDMIWTDVTATQAFVHLYLEMSKNYRDQLAKWIDENFKG
jgi:hypothetical protein